MSIIAPAPVTAKVADRIRGCLYGSLIGDALSMPVHWYYNPVDIQRDYGFISGYEAPKQRHPTSIMSVSNTGGHGRGGTQGRIIGDVINHGKHERWGKKGVHYHEGMKAGQNTLNALCMRLVVKGITADNGTYSKDTFLKNYISFMTTPGSHDDTYAESYHRDFFRNYVDGVEPLLCSKGTEGHNTASIGGFVTLPPVIITGYINGGIDLAVRNAVEHLSLTHESEKLATFAEAYTKLLIQVLTAPERASLALKQGAEKTAQALTSSDLASTLRFYGSDDVGAVHGVFGSACYIDSSFPALLYLGYKYCDAFEKGVLSNTNIGGENCHRGSALGSLLGAAAGASKIPDRFKQGLADTEVIHNEIEAFIKSLNP